MAAAARCPAQVSAAAAWERARAAPSPRDGRRRSTRLGGQEPGLGVRVAKGVDLPRAPWIRLAPKGLEEPLVASGRLVDHRRPERRRLVVHAPAAVDELELSAFHKSAGAVALHL